MTSHGQIEIQRLRQELADSRQHTDRWMLRLMVLIVLLVLAAVAISVASLL